MCVGPKSLVPGPGVRTGCTSAVITGRNRSNSVYGSYLVSRRMNQASQVSSGNRAYGRLHRFHDCPQSHWAGFAILNPPESIYTNSIE